MNGKKELRKAFKCKPSPLGNRKVDIGGPGHGDTYCFVLLARLLEQLVAQDQAEVEGKLFLLYTADACRIVGRTARFAFRAAMTGIEHDCSEVRCTSYFCLLYTSPSPRDGLLSRMPSSA